MIEGPPVGRLVETRRFAITVFRGRTLAIRLAFWIAGSSILIYSAAVYLDYALSKRHIVEKSELQATQLVNSAVTDLTAALAGVQRSTDLFAEVLGATHPPRDEAARILRDVVAHRDDIYGATIALEPTEEHPAGFAPYFFHSRGEVRYADLTAPSYRFTTKDWYTEPRRLRHAVWSEPYYDEGGGNVLMTTYSAPLLGGRDFTGVVTADVTLENLQNYLGRIRLGTTGYAALLSREGRLLSHPDSTLLMKPIGEAVPRLANDPAWRDALARTLQGTTGTERVPCPHAAGDCLFAHSPLGETGWPIVVLYPEREMLSDLRAHSAKVVMISAFGIALLILAVTLVSQTITKPLVALSAASDRLGQGDLDVALPPVQSEDEVGHLIGAFGKMRARLKDFIARLETETASRNRLQGELDAAHQIQMEMLPQQGNAFVSDPRYQLWARLVPAKAVGGDLYTWLDVGGGSMLVVVGDVSDKGVAAALFMARTITLLQEYAVTSQSPSEILERLNTSLLDNNDACMFATLFCGLFEPEHGVLRFASGGHTPPMLVRDGKAAPVAQENGPALGVSDGAKYPGNRLALQPGDMLAVYTDGVDEAFNPDDEMFGHDRLAQTLVGDAEHDVRTSGERVLEAVKRFAKGRSQSDDITIVLLEWKGRPSLLATMHPSAAASRRFRAQVAELESLFGWIAEWLASQRIASPDLVSELRLIAEEVFLNIVSYSGLSEHDSVDVVLARDESRVALEFVDRGRAWNPLEQAPEPKLGQATEDADVGGLGVYLVHELTDERLYRRDDGANRFCLLKSLA
jgi:sigma-B regulation protein RsbU (phosphoserine phosphatase)